MEHGKILSPVRSYWQTANLVLLLAEYVKVISPLTDLETTLIESPAHAACCLPLPPPCPQLPPA